MLVATAGSSSNENQAPWIKSRLLSAPSLARRGDVGPVLFGGVQDFF
jgi:hypothetical protein